MSEQKLTEYSLRPQEYLLAEATASSEPSSITSKLNDVKFNTGFAPSLSYVQGKFFMAISYTVNGEEQHQRIPLDGIQTAYLVSQGAKALAAYVNYDLREGVAE